MWILLKGGNRCSIDQTSNNFLQLSQAYRSLVAREFPPIHIHIRPFVHSTPTAMRFLHSFVTPLVLLAAGAAQAASSWGFDDATVQVNAKKAAGHKEKCVGSRLEH